MADETAPKRAEVRRTAKFPPSVWGDFFIKQVPHDNDEIIGAWIEEAEALKEDVRRTLAASADKPSDKLNMIDAVQRLGIAYHFEREIIEALQEVYNTFQGFDNDEDHEQEDLFTFALRFRLLRQQGYNFSSETFKRFKEEDGNFKKCLINDVRGLLSLHEASYYSVPGEVILDEALEFSKTHLMSMKTKLDSPLAEQVTHALRWPILKGLPRKETLHYISFYQQEEAHNETVLKLAKLDFNILQKLHQRELKSISQWWVDLDVAANLSFARDRVAEAFFWTSGAFYEPKYALSRRLLSTTFALMTIVDDVYDVHGTIDELELLTTAIERWDVGLKDGLPDLMKLIFQLIIDLYAEIEEEVTKQGRSFCAYYAKEAIKQQMRAYMAETRWFNKDYVPTLEEYLSTSTDSSVYPLAYVIFYCGMDEISSGEVFDWLLTKPKIWNAATVIARLKDDIVSHEFEQSRGHVASAVECYMKQHGVSREQAQTELRKLCGDLWKELNEELLKPTNFPRVVLTVLLNFVRVLELIYEYEDGFTYSELVLKDVIKATLVDPIAT